MGVVQSSEQWSTLSDSINCWIFSSNIYEPNRDFIVSYKLLLLAATYLLRLFLCELSGRTTLCSYFDVVGAPILSAERRCVQCCLWIRSNGRLSLLYPTFSSIWLSWANQNFVYLSGWLVGCLCVQTLWLTAALEREMKWTRVNNNCVHGNLIWWVRMDCGMDLRDPILHYIPSTAKVWQLELVQWDKREKWGLRLTFSEMWKLKKLFKHKEEGNDI